ncbi:TNF receptor-associated factor 6-like [Mercenaria mercenaria]|uniref:TNF receptor-associated factor 6-like n=1 Tax=Mercenaria mercenaria TaxID=6596 RepID=UPI00234EA21B|nr:TNF receptor-associated factor 6-like [Mercenaria mercenaria]XP_045176493.2 TNF receptor-associated factor 6-like [Mercenaria mercenaria]XP_045176494.2 TNF receptor-associated factor 6-like [Mercenaria mercenaria]XP_053385307.1 TNF receptor-associated factor 6-like [Mercenaria mercenaria]XP_053385308.1 TNF receptor-associated factor 6-like [Mercenaria mercenaria]
MENSCRAGSFPNLPPNTGQDVTSLSGSQPSLTSIHNRQSVRTPRSAPLGSGNVSHPPLCRNVSAVTGGASIVSGSLYFPSGSSSVETGNIRLATGSLPFASNSSWPSSAVPRANASLAPNNGVSSAPSTGQFPATNAGNRDSSGSSSSGSSGDSGYAHILDNEEGWDLVFVPHRSEKYDCPICLLVLREPMQTECGHRFCRACILKWLRESEARCPVDNQPLQENQLFPDNFAKREILMLTVKCPNCTKGCDQIVVLKHLQTHLDNCVFSLTPCPNECANVLLRGRLSEHLLNQCPKRIIKCSLCQLDLVAEKQQEHMLDCPQAIIDCSSCELQLKRHLLSQHLNTECKKASTKCQYHMLGCPYQGERVTLEDHENSSLAYHMSLINLSIIRLFTLLRINPQNLQSAHRPSSLGYQPTEGAGGSGASSFPSYFVNPKESMNLLHHLFQQLQLNPSDLNNVTVSEVNVCQSLPTSGSNVESMQASGMNILYASPGSVSIATAQNLGIPISQAQASGQNTEDEQNDSERTSSNQTRYQTLSYTSEPSNRQDNKEVPQMSLNENQLFTIKCQNDIQDESLARHDQQLLDLSHQKDYHDKVIRELKGKVKSLESTIQDMEGRCGNGIYVWKIKNYLKLRRDAERGEITAIHSASFYSGYYGYKLCIRVNPNGVDSAKGTHLSLFIHFMQGENDDLLEWPFSGRIVLTIIDQNPICEMRNHISETLMSKPNLAAFQRPVSMRNHKGFGYMEFLPLSVIDGSTYIKNDTLIIKANVIPSSP